MNKENFSVKFLGIKLVGDIVPANSRPAVLCLHGAGPASRQRFEKLRELLAKKDIASCAFDFIGHGNTGSDLFSSSLENRVKQSLAVIESRALLQPLSIIASSMSGYVAVKLTELCTVKNLIFLAPAIYASKAYPVHFGQRFTEIIRKPHSWRDSDAWKILESYEGSLLIFAAEKDQIVPDEVGKRIYDSASNAKSGEMIVIKNATHPLGKWLDEHPTELREASSKMLKLLQAP